MNHTFKTLALAVLSAFAFSSCSHENITQEKNGVHFIVRTSENPQVKSFIENNLDGTYTPKWSKDDKLAIFIGEIKTDTKPTATLTNTANEAETASFEGDINSSNITEEGSFVSIAPAAAVGVGYADSSVGVELPSIQTPSDLTIDQDCDILVSKPCDYAIVDGTAMIDDLYFKRMFSILKINVKGLEKMNGQKIEAFTFTAPESITLAGRAAISLSDATVSKWTVKSNSVTARYTESAPTFGGEDGLENTIWFVVNPQTISQGNDIVFSGETADYTFSKKISLTKGLTFPESQIAVINLTINDDNCSEKVAETRIFVESFDGATDSKQQYQPSATGAKGTGVSENLKYEYSVESGTDIRININGITNKNPYLYISKETYFAVLNITTSGKSSLKLSFKAKTLTKTPSTLNIYYKEAESDEWAMVCDGITTSDSWTNNTALFTVNSTASSIDLKFETTGNQTLVDDIVLEEFVDTRTKLASPSSLSAKLDESTANKINISWDTVENAGSYKVILSTAGAADIEKSTAETSLSISGLEYSTEYSIKVAAISSDIEKFFDSDYCDAVSVTTGEKTAGTTIKTYTLQFGKDYNSKGVNSYTNSWAATCEDFTWDLVNWNNNNNGWNEVRAGSKNAASVATITTNTTIPEAISTVKMTITKVTAANINAIKLEVLSGDTVKETITGTAAVGDCVFNITAPQKDCKYKITVDCKKSANGTITVSKVIYTE